MSLMGTAGIGPAIVVEDSHPRLSRSPGAAVLLLLRRRLCGGRRSGACRLRGLVETLDHRVGDVDRIGRIDQAGLELVENYGEAHLFADLIDHRLDLALQ